MEDFLEKIDNRFKGDSEAHRAIWQAAKTELPEPPDTSAQWRVLKAAMDQAQPAPSRFRMPIFAAGALAAAVILIVIGLQFGPSHPTEVLSQPGELSTLTLADDSTITLNAGSKLSYADDFNKAHRLVTLEGEAFFNVEKSEHPFIVHAGDAEVEVLGTQFNVYARDGQVRVGVKEGRVSVSSDGEEHILTAGQFLHLTDSVAPVETRKVSPKNFMSWINGELRFNAEPVAKICEEMSRYMNTTIRLHPSIPGDLELGGGYLADPNDPSIAIATLCTVIGGEINSDVIYEIQQDGTFLIRRD